MTGWLLVSLVLAVLTVRSRPRAAIRVRATRRPRR